MNEVCIFVTVYTYIFKTVYYNFMMVQIGKETCS